jgi:hypothetical protein
LAFGKPLHTFPDHALASVTSDLIRYWWTHGCTAAMRGKSASPQERPEKGFQPWQNHRMLASFHLARAQGRASAAD